MAITVPNVECELLSAQVSTGVVARNMRWPQMTSGLKLVQQEVKVNEAAEVPPAFKDPSYIFIVESHGQPQSAIQIVSCTDVVAREYMLSAQATMKRVLRRPAANAAHAAQFGDSCTVRKCQYQLVRHYLENVGLRISMTFESNTVHVRIKWPAPELTSKACADHWQITNWTAFANLVFTLS